MVNPSKAAEQRFWNRWQESGAVGRMLNKGFMPRTDFRYEEFEGLLGSFYLSLEPLQGSSVDADRADYQRAVNILDGFAERHGVQPPKRVVKAPPRAGVDWGKPKAFGSCWSTLDMMGSFWRDYGVGATPGTEDFEARNDLGRLILGVFDRHGVAEVGYEEIDGRQTPVSVESWKGPKQSAPLADVVAVYTTPN